jgi:sugar porter (SP) family MFS transporter
MSSYGSAGSFLAERDDELDPPNEDETLIDSKKVYQNSNNESSSNDKNSSSYNTCSVLMIFLFPALGGLLFGYDIGATSAVLTQLESKTYSGVQWTDQVNNSSFLRGTITSIGMFGALLGSTTCFAVADNLGRKRSLLLASFLFCVGAIIDAISGNPNWDATTGISVLLTGRLIYGYGCGFAMHGAPAYIGEMSPNSIRGLLVSMKEAFIVLGMVCGYSVGYGYSGVVGGWRATYAWASPVAVIMFVGITYLPYSARWLALKGRINEARRSLKFVTPNIPESEIQAIKEAADKAAESMNDNTTLMGDFRRLTGPTIFPALVAGVGLVFLQQVTGQPSVLYYANTIFKDVGLNSLASVGVSVFKLIATLFATFTVDNYGRKLLLYIGCTLMLIALLMLGTTFLFDYMSASDCNEYVSTETCPIDSCAWSTTCNNDCDTSGYTNDDCVCCGTGGINSQKATILVALFIYIGGYQVGFGPISWLIISEIFPLEVRGKAVSIAVVSNFFWNTVMTFFFPVELEFIGASATFYLYACVLTWGIYFIYYRVPETKGLSLEQIEEFFIRSSLVLGTSNNNGGLPSKEKREEVKLVPEL